MKKNILWDFDETILPFDHDIQFSIDVIDNSKSLNKIYKLITFKIARFLEKRRINYKHIKPLYLKVFRGSSIEFMNKVSSDYGSKIPKEYVKVIKKAKNKGYKNYIISCGNTQMITKMLEQADLLDDFEGVYANTFKFKNKKITGSKYEVINSQKKPLVMEQIGIADNNSIVIGDGLFDIPMMEKAKLPILIGRKPEMIKIAKANKWVIVKDLIEVEKYLK